MNKSCFQKNFKNCLLKKYSLRVILDRYLWIQSSRFRARIAKGRPAFRDRITKAIPRVQNCTSKGRSGLRKPKTISVMASTTAAITLTILEGCCFADGILYLLVRGFRRKNLKIRIFLDHAHSILKHLYCWLWTCSTPNFFQRHVI